MINYRQNNLGKFTLANRSDKVAIPAIRLDGLLTKFMENVIEPKYEQFQNISEVLRNFLPSEIYEHCRIDSISAGQLKIYVDSPPYMYQLQLYSHDILEELKRCCPQYHIKRLKTSIY